MTIQTLNLEEGRRFSCDPSVASRLRALLPSESYEEREGQSIISRMAGLIQINRTTQVRIRSRKASGAALLAWQAYLDPSLRSAARLGLAPQAGEGGELVEALAVTFCRLFLQTVGRCGVSRAYLQRQHVGAEVVGRIDFAKLTRSGGNLTAVPCTVWRRLPDTPWNQLIAAALRKIRRHPSLRAACRTDLAACEALLEGVNAHSSKLANPNELPRTAQPFAPVCVLARLLLDNGGMDEGESQAGLSFLINLEALFEKTIVKAFQDAGIDCLPKQPLPYRRNDRGASFQMDLYCPNFHGQPLVVDAKFKTDVSSANLHQMVTYCVMTGARRAVLVLPSSDDVAPSTYVVPTSHGTISIDVVKFDVDNRTVEDWRRSAARLIHALTESQRPPADSQAGPEPAEIVKTEAPELTEVEALIDPAYLHLLEICRRGDLSPPIVGFSLMSGHRIVADAELAWEEKRMAMVLEESDRREFRAAGWTVYSPEEFEERYVGVSIAEPSMHPFAKS